MTRRRQAPGSPRVPIALMLVGVAIIALAMGLRELTRSTSIDVGADDFVPTAPVLTYQIVRAYPHDPEAFTQGLFFDGGWLYESTGREGRSTVRQVALETGQVERSRPLAPSYFGEGLARWGDRLLQLTYKTGVAFIYDRATFAPLGTFTYAGEGWGLAADDRRLIMSDGSADLRFLEPSTFREIGRLTVRDGTTLVTRLNELEVVNGAIYANVFRTDRIAVISADSGAVTAWINLAGLRPATARDPRAVLNGIAYDAASNRLFVTGKWWPTVFEIQVHPRILP